MIGDDIEIIITHIMEDRVKIGIKAPKDTKIYRKELIEAIERENRQSILAEKEKLDSLNILLEKNK